jgi:hypothetical protein
VPLIIGGFVAAFFCISAVLGTVGAILSGEWLHGLVAGPIVFFFFLAVLVVFVRVSRL